MLRPETEPDVLVQMLEHGRGFASSGVDLQTINPLTNNINRLLIDQLRTDRRHAITVNTLDS